MNIADRLSSLMRWRGIRGQRHLARLSGVPQTSIHRILADRPGYAPSYATVGKLADALAVSADWLRGGDPAARRRLPAVAKPSRAHRPTRRDEHDEAEIRRLLAMLTASERRKIMAVVRLVAQGRLPPTAAAEAARRS